MPAAAMRTAARDARWAEGTRRRPSRRGSGRGGRSYRNSPKPPRSPSSSVSLSTAATIAASSASAAESKGRRLAARARTRPAPSSNPVAARIEQAGNEGQWKLREDAVDGAACIEAELLRGPQPDQTDEERRDPGDANQVQRDGVTIPELPSLHRRDGTWRASGSALQGGVGAGGGIRTRDNRLGRPAL